MFSKSFLINLTKFSPRSTIALGSPRRCQIKTKTEFLESLLATTSQLNAKLPPLEWFVQGTVNQRVEIFFLHIFQANRRVNQIKQKLVGSMSASIDFMHTNFNQLSVKEKAAAFRLFSVLYPHYNTAVDPALARLLLRLEIDYYANSIDQCDMIDLINYADGFKFYRFLSGKTHFQAATANIAFEKVFKSVRDHRFQTTNERADADSLLVNKLNCQVTLCTRPDLTSACFMLHKVRGLTLDAWSLFVHIVMIQSRDRLFYTNSTDTLQIVEIGKSLLVLRFFVEL